jgi:hypothetical protein
MLVPHLNFICTSIPNEVAWERGKDISKRLVHNLQQASGPPLVTRYITTFNMEIYQFYHVLLTMLLFPIWLLLGSVEDIVTALYFLVGMPDWSDLDVTAATSSEAARLVRCFQTPFPGSFEVVTTGCRPTPSSPSDGSLLRSHASVKLHNIIQELCITDKL